MDNSIVALARAWDFAARKHMDQRRKGERQEPYVNHLAEVSALLAEATGGRDPDLVIAGVLHDTLEDTETTRDELTALFGTDVASLVTEVSDDTSLPKAERKRRQVTETPHKSQRARMIKLADKTSNLRALSESPPADWPLARQREYFHWARAVIAGCCGVDPSLEAEFRRAYADGMQRLGEAPPVE